jgi:shikimate kinase
MAVILITGVPGSGKSSVAEELSRRGFSALDADEEASLSGWVDVVAPGERPSDASANWFTNHRWEWNASRLDDLVDEIGVDTLFICGSASNLEELVGRFSKVIALEIDVDTLADRLDAIDQAYGFRSENGNTREQIQRWLPTDQDRLRELGADMVDGRRPIEEVVNQILVTAGIPSRKADR